MKTEKITYQDKNVTLEGYVAFKEDHKKKMPLVLIAHDWTGRNEFACKKAEALAELGYVGFALDMYGQGLLGKNNEEKSQLMQPLASDRALLRERVLAGYHQALTLDMVDTKKLAVIGFCFGGMCALDLARSGVDLNGAVSFHGLLSAPQGVSKEKIKAKILAFHGYNDPMANADQVREFEQEMSEAGVDWQLHLFGNTLHAFTNPAANDQKLGLVYNELANNRSWRGLQDFLSEIFA